MVGFQSPFSDTDDSDIFDSYYEFGPAHLPEPGDFLEGHEVLTGDDHVAFHDLTKDLFEERGVYDMTFGYNLARLNLDQRHSNAGYRYAENTDDSSILHAEFTPTTPFCPQSHTLAKGSFRAWNGLINRHEYDLVRVRVASMHHESDLINDGLREHEEYFQRTESVRRVGSSDGERRSNPTGQPNRSEGENRGPHTPF